MKKKLVLITASFPYGKQETFLENEIPILAKAFDKITILHSYNDGTKRAIPTNVNCIHTPLDLNKKETLKSNFHLLSILVWKEIFRMLFIYKQIPTIGFFKTLFISISKGKKMQKAIEKHLSSNEIKTSILYSYWCDDHSIGLAFLNKKYNEQLKTVTRAHRWDIYFEENKYNYLPLRHFINKYLSKIYFISQDGFDYCEKKWKCTSKIGVSKLGVKKQIEFNDLKHSNEEINIVSCSNLIDVKRVDLIIEALGLINDLKINWFHFGDGKKELQLKQLAQQKLNININTYWKGRVANEEVLNFYKQIYPTLFINVSSSEGIPVSIMEAMSMGIPCVATNVGGNAEIVTNQNGRLIPENCTPDIIKNAIIEILKATDDEKKALIQNAFFTWEKNYNARKNYNEFINELVKLS